MAPRADVYEPKPTDDVSCYTLGCPEKRTNRRRRYQLPRNLRPPPCQGRLQIPHRSVLSRARFPSGGSDIAMSPRFSDTLDT